LADWVAGVGVNKPERLTTEQIKQDIAPALGKDFSGDDPRVHAVVKEMLSEAGYEKRGRLHPAFVPVATPSDEEVKAIEKAEQLRRIEILIDHPQGMYTSATRWNEHNP
jgi:hypothetical protein